MDVDCIPLCDALNALPGIKTVESCCGHGQATHRIFFTAGSVEALGPILQACESSGWDVEVFWVNGQGVAMFVLEGPIGPPDIAGGANDFGSWLKDFMP